MNYPLISEYVEAIRFAEDNFSTLTNLRPVLENGRLFMSSGNFAVVFKMKDVVTGKLYAVKCFTREEEHRERSYRLISDELNGVDSPYLTSIKYLEKELFVNVSGSAENEFPVLLMDWVEGQTMDAYIRENINDKWELERLCRNFCRMGAWLLEQPFAHGDLKPENIMVSADAMPLLVDYDGMYVPAMKGEVARELGSPDYRHPLRTEKDFDEHIDDFPLASIALSLKAISSDPSLLKRYGAADRLLFSEKDYMDLSKCEVLKEITSLLSDPELQKLHSIFLLASSQKSLPSSMSQMFIPTDSENEREIPSTKVTKEDLEEAWEDEYGVLYSKDRNRLLKSKKRNLTEYVVMEGTMAICDEAFHKEYWDEDLKHITLPKSLISIGYNAFLRCCNLTSITLPNGLTSIGGYAFSGCKNLTSIKLPDSLTSIGGHAFSECENLTSIKLPNSLTSIGNWTFARCRNLASIKLPDSLTSIGNWTFLECENLTSIELPNSLTKIRDCTFAGCRNLASINLPDSLISIGDSAFHGCENLTKIELPKKLQRIGGQPFNNIIQISNSSPFFKVENDLLIQNNTIIRVSGNPKHVKIPWHITSIGNSAFSSCKELSSVDLPYSLTSIGYCAFQGCENLVSIELPNSLISIKNHAFSGCERLISITLPKNLQNIKGDPFAHCNAKILCNSPYFVIENDLLIQSKAVICIIGSPNKITIPDYITHISDGTLVGRENLISIELPCDLTSIGITPFYGCTNLEKIYISCTKNADKTSVLEKFKKQLPKELWDKIEIVEKK